MRSARTQVGWSRRRLPLVLGCYLVLCIAYFWPVFARSEVPLPLMNPYTQGDPVWSGYAPAATAAGSNRLLGDVSGFYYPYLVFSVDTLRHGIFPLWNPDLYGGIPFFAANQAALLYPINLIGFWFGPQWFWTVTAILRLLIAGGGMYLFARRMQVSDLGALLAGGVYMLAAFQVVWLHFAIHNVAALLPLALWLIVRIINAQRPTSTSDTPQQLPCKIQNPRSVLALASIVAAQMFGGHPEMSLFFMVICGAFATVQAHGCWLDDRRQTQTQRYWRWSHCFKLRATSAVLLFPVVIACTLGLALSAVQWLPTLGLIRTSYTLEERGFAASQRDIPDDYAPLGGLQRAEFGNLRHWLLLVAPELWGSPRGDQINYWLDRTNYNEMASYVGLVVLPLVVLGAWRGKARRVAWFFGAMFVVSLLFLYPLPGLRLLGFLPLFSIAYGFRFGLGITLAAAVLAGFGLDVLRDMRARTCWFVVGALLLLAALNFAVAYDLWNDDLLRWVLDAPSTATTQAMIGSVFNSANWRPVVPGIAGILAACVLADMARERLARSRALALIVVLALAEITVYGYGYNGFVASASIYPRTAAIDRLKLDTGLHMPNNGSIRDLQSRSNGLFRVLNLDGALWANSAMTHDIQVTGGLDDLVPGDQGRFVKRGMAGVVKIGDRHVLMDWGQRFMQLMNVRYVLARGLVTLYQHHKPLARELHDRDVDVYRNDDTLPRAYAATFVMRSTPRDAENTVFDARFDPQRMVVLEEAPAGFTPTAPTHVQAVPIVSYTPNWVELAPNIATPSIVVLADAYSADWHVTIDGQSAPLLRANALFRGVVVPAGQHRVVFTYWPRLVEWGGLASAVALLICVVWGGVRLRRAN